MAHSRTDYTIAEHVHRFAAWAASRAASTTKGCRFKVAVGRAIIEDAKLTQLLSGPDALPAPPEMDACHRHWRTTVIDAAGAYHLDFTHGVAAKLINVYLKAGLVTTAYHDDSRVRALHPPIDRELLKGLASLEGGKHWRRMQNIGWSNFNSPQYEAVIAAIREFLGSQKPLWAIEEWWRGFQS